MPSAPQVRPEPPAKEVDQLPWQCASDSAEWFTQNFSKPEEPVSVEGGGSTTTLPLEYHNHYSSARNGCFALLSQLTSFKSDLRSKSKDYIVVTHTLWNVNEKSRLGIYAVKNVEAMTACNVSGVTCMSKDQWLEMTRPYMTD